MTFEDLNLIEPILRALKEEGYTHPTPIQQQAIPIVLQGTDLLGCAQTGTGKTAAFAIPTLQLLYNQKASRKGATHCSSLILTPTRELAIQISESFSAYGKHTGIRNQVIFGGVGANAQIRGLQRGTDVLIATPGRLLDLMNQGFVNLQNVQIFTLDEADRMLDMGFINDVKKVLRKLPEKKQTLFFSATMPPDIQKLADTILHKPTKVAVDPVSSTVDMIQQSLYYVDKKTKKDLLHHLLRDPAIKSALVFSTTKHGANRLEKDLNLAGFKAEAIHGNKSQNARQNALSNFKSGKTRILVATDIAARGIDVDELSHVINYDLPNVPETYVHRIGRTGRAGHDGIAISFCDTEERPFLKDIQKLIGKQLPVVESHPFLPRHGGAEPPLEQKKQLTRGEHKPATPSSARNKDRKSNWGKKRGAAGNGARKPNSQGTGNLNTPRPNSQGGNKPA